MKSKNGFITRTITSIKATVMVLNLTTNEVSEIEVAAPKPNRILKTVEAQECYVSKYIDDVYKVVRIVETEDVDTTYAMPLKQFMDEATIWNENEEE